MRRPLSGGITAAAGVAALVVGLAAIDPRVREQIAGVLSRPSRSSDQIVTLGTYFENLLAIVLQALRDQSLEHAPLVIFTLAALVLVSFMLRT